MPPPRISAWRAEGLHGEGVADRVTNRGENWFSIGAYSNLSYQFEILAKAAGAEAFVLKEDLEQIRSWIEAFWMDGSTHKEENP